MTRGRAWWACWFAVGLAREIRAIRSGSSDRTLTEFTRWTFAMDHPVGRAAWLIGWPAATGWVLSHIVEGKRHVQQRTEHL